MRGSSDPRAGSPRSAGAVLVLLLAMLVPATAAAEVFDFDSAPIHASLPIDQTVGGITAHLSATGQGFSIQAANTMGFTPAGFGGLCIYPNSIYAADLLVSFSVPLTQFSILYAPQELGCDNSAIMRVTAYMDGVLRGTATTTAPAPGTWPTRTLRYDDPTEFNQVVVHYDKGPVCGDWGPIFVADVMTVTPSTLSVPATGSAGPRAVVSPNPFRATTRVRLQLARTEPLTVTIHDAAGRRIRTLVHAATFDAGDRSIEWNGRDDAGGTVGSGVYFCHINSSSGVRVIPMILRR